MTDHSKDNLSGDKSQDNGKPTLPELTFQDEDKDEDYSDFDRTINLGTLPVPDSDTQNADPPVKFDSMESLFDEELAKPDAGTGHADTHIEPELEKPDDAYDLGINTGELEGLKDFMVEDDDEESAPTVALADMPDEEDEPSDIDSIMKDIEEQMESPGNSLNDENSESAHSNKKIELTEADYADTDAGNAGTSEDPEDIREAPEPDAESGTEEPQTADAIPDNIPEPVREPENVIDSQVIAAAAMEAHAVQDKPEDDVPDASPENPEIAPAPEPATPPAAQPRTGMATAFGLVGIIGASSALWMIFDLSGRINQMESQVAAMQQQSAAPGPGKDIASLNRRIDDLSTQLAAHLKAIAQTKEVPPAPDVKKPSAPSPVATKPIVTAITPSMDSGHGPWVVNLTSLSHATAANNEVARLKGLGIRAESIKIETQGKVWYRIRVPGFASAEEADRQRKILGNRLGIRDTWIGKR